MIKRHITHLIRKSLQQFPVVLLNGARQVGKSTIAQQLVKNGDIKEYISLDDITYLEAAKKDPQGFIAQFSESVAIDEIQRAPELLLAIKRNVDTKKTKGKFLLTGSANILSYPETRDSLAGRMDIISLEGLSVGELMQCRDKSNFVEDLFSVRDINGLIAKWNYELSAKPAITNKALQEQLFYGGFPDVAIEKDQDYRNRWLASYITAYVERDIRDLSRLLDIVSFAKLLRITALRSGNILNNNNLSIATELDHRTVVRYIELLEISFQINILRPWSSNLGKRYIKTPKVYMRDVGLASYFAGIFDEALIKQHPNFGSLVETWVFSELRKTLSFIPMSEIYFYRNHQNVEVDFLISQGNKMIGIECKSSTSVLPRDYKSLKFVSAEIKSDKSDFVGIVMYRGDRVIRLDDRILAVPFEILL